MGTAVLGLGLALAAPAAAAPTAITVGTAGPNCKGPTQPTVIEAVDAAASGAVITVCPGVYKGTVVVNKPLTLRGAQHGVDARAGRTDVARESVIDGDGGAGIQITGTTSGVTVDGFTIRNSGTDTQVHDGIEAFSGGGGFSFVNNVIGLVVSGNHIVSRKNGMQLTAQTSGSIKNNDVAQSTAVGILLDSDNAGVTLTGNKVAASTTFDCQDGSTGNKTPGTANTWMGNVGLRSQPKALCGAR